MTRSQRLNHHGCGDSCISKSSPTMPAELFQPIPPACCGPRTIANIRRSVSVYPAAPAVSAVKWDRGLRVLSQTRKPRAPSHFTAEKAGGDGYTDTDRRMYMRSFTAVHHSKQGESAETTRLAWSGRIFIYMNPHSHVGSSVGF